METTLTILTNSLAETGVPKDFIFQVAWYTPDFDSNPFAREEDGIRWTSARRTEMIRVYPGREAPRQAVFYVRHNRKIMKGVEIELIRPLTEPNYISILGLRPGQIAHLGVEAKRFGDANDLQILRRFSDLAPQTIQKGEVRSGKCTHYAIYQLDDFLPVKIVREAKNDDGDD